MTKRTASQIASSNVRNSKSHERTVAKLLTEWSGIEFCRRKVEGHGRQVVRRNLCGDVIPVNEDVKLRFSVEAKSGKSFSINALVTTPETCIFSEWWSQTQYDAGLLSEEFGRIVYPMLFFKANQNSHWVAISAKAYDTFTFNQGKRWLQGLRFNDYEELSVTHETPFGDSTIQLENCILSNWNKFKEAIDPQSLFIHS